MPTPLPSMPSTPRVLSRKSSYSNFGSFHSKGEEVGFVALEDVNKLTDAHNSATFDTFSKPSLRTAGQIRWNSRDPEAFVVVNADEETRESGAETLEVRIMRKHVESLINPSADIARLLCDQSVLQSQRIGGVRQWFEKHPGVKPLVKVLTRRSKFTGSLPEGETWAYLDRDVRMVPNNKKPGWLLTDEDEGCENAVEFPYAVLEIQWLGDTPNFIHELRQSHMVGAYLVVAAGLD